MSGGLAHLGSMLRLVARGLRARGEPPVLPDVPRRKPAVERDGVSVDAREVERYAAATAGEGVEWRKGGEVVVPPVLPATWETVQALELFTRLEHPLPVGALVHLESELLSLRTLAAGDRVRCRVELERAERVKRGIRLTLTARNWVGAGQLCTQSTAVFLAKTPADDAARDDGARGTTRGEGDPRAEPPAEWEEVAGWRLSAGAGRRYARVSGDWNPIHLYGWTARPFGFRAPILHGYCTEAMVAHALIQHRFGGDPAALRRLRIVFRSPLLLPARPRLLVGERLGQRWFRVASEDGAKVHAEGTYAGGSQVGRPSLRLVK